MTPDQFLARCTQIWHVAPPGAWESISTDGLRTAQQLIDAAELDEDERRSLHENPRSEDVRLTVGDREVTLRDQEPLLRADLASRLTGDITLSDWVQRLNRRAYLFTDRAAMTKMLTKHVERDGAQEVLTFSPSRLLEAARFQIELTSQRSGAIARRSDAYKGDDTFLSITRFPDRKPAEITIVDGLTDTAGIVVRVERHEMNCNPVDITRSAS